MNPICVKCKKEMKCKKNGVWVQVCESVNARSMISGDLYACKCGNEIVTGFSEQFCVTEHPFKFRESEIIKLK